MAGKLCQTILTVVYQWLLALVSGLVPWPRERSGGSWARPGSLGKCADMGTMGPTPSAPDLFPSSDLWAQPDRRWQMGPVQSEASQQRYPRPPMPASWAPGTKSGFAVDAVCLSVGGPKAKATERLGRAESAPLARGKKQRRGQWDTRALPAPVASSLGVDSFGEKVP